MRDQFPGFYRPTPEQFEALWRDATIALDANLLLNLYRYSTPTAKQLLDILRAIGDRLWVPHQAALEFHKNRLEVIQQRADMYGDLVNEIEKAYRTLMAAAERLQRHPELDEDVIRKHATAMYEALGVYVEERRGASVNLLEDDPLDDPLLRDVTKLLEGKVGPSFTREDLDALYKLARVRFDARRPPGYEDARSKDEPERFGDFVLWEQVLRHAEANKRPVIFVTDDDKGDWWWKRQGKTIGPRQELVEEMIERAGVGFYMYRPSRFMDEAGRYLDLGGVESTAIEEARTTVPWRDDLDEYVNLQMLPFETEHVGYRAPFVCKIIGITYRQLDYWSRTGLVTPSQAAVGMQRLYSYRDLFELMIVKRLLDAGLSLQSVRRAVEYLHGSPRINLLSANLVVDGNKVDIVTSSEELVDTLRTSPGVLNVVPLADVRKELDAAIARGFFSPPPGAGDPDPPDEVA